MAQTGSYTHISHIDIANGDSKANNTYSKRN